MKGIVEGMTNEDYHAHTALGSTQVKAAIKSLAHFKAMRDGKLIKKSDAMDLGSAVHSAILEGSMEGFIQVPKGLVRNDKHQAWKDFKAKNVGKTMLTFDDYSKVENMFCAFYRTEIAAKLLCKGRAELSFFAKDPTTGLELRARPDYFVETDEWVYIVDLKTSKDASPEAFQKDVYNYRYDISAAHYIKVVELVTGKKVKDYFILAVESSVPHGTAIYRLDEDCLARADKRLSCVLSQIAKAQEDKIYSGYSEKVVDLDIPHWAIRSEDETLNQEVVNE